MKKLLNIILITGVLLCYGCKKESDSFSVYRINSVKRPGTFACQFTARSTGKPDLVFWDECEKYKVGDTFKVELK